MSSASASLSGTTGVTHCQAVGRASTRLGHGPVVVATDVSGVDSFAARYAQALARQQRTQVIAVPLHRGILCAERSAAAGMRTGAPDDRGVEALLRAADQHAAGLIVLGAGGEDRVERAALGITARRLLQDAPCPVLVLGSARAASLSQPTRWRRVLAPVDFSAASIRALHYAHALSGEELIALHCAACGNTSCCSKCLERLRLLTHFDEAHPVAVRHIVCSGDSAELIAQYADALRVDLLVMGPPALAQTHAGRPATSTVCQLLDAVECPVLLVPRGPDAGQPEIRSVTLAGALPR